MQYIKLFKDLPCNKDLTAMESIILGHIIDLSHKYQFCYANNKALADKANCGEEKVKIAIRKLKELKVIYTTSPNQQRQIYLHDQYKHLLVVKKKAKKNENMDRGEKIAQEFKVKDARIKELQEELRTTAYMERERCSLLNKYGL